MLTVGIQLDGDVEIVAAGVLEAGLNRGADAEVERQADHARPGGQRKLARRVGRAVVHHEDLEARIELADLRDHRRHRALLVECGKDRQEPQWRARSHICLYRRRNRCP